MPKAFKIEEPWFGSFTPADPNLPPLLFPAEEPPLPLPEAVAAVPNTYPAGRTYEGFLYELITSGIAGMGDTLISAPSDGQALVWNNGLGKWVNGNPTGGAFLPLVGGTLTGTPGTLVVNAPNAASGAILTAQVNGSQRLLVSADADHILTLADASTTGPTATLRIAHKSTSGTPNVGFGSSLQFWGEDDSGAAGSRLAIEYATIRTEASSTAAGSVSSDLVMMNKVSGTSTEGLRFKGSDGRAIFAGALQSPALHVGDLVTHPATAHISRASGAANPTIPTYLRVKSVADTNLAQGAIDVEFDFTATRQLQAGGGTLAAQNTMVVSGASYSATGALTITEATGLFLNSLPIAGTNVTFTNRYALYVNGPSRFEGGTSGGISYVWKLPTDNTALTGGITGRIPINIAGNLRYIPYYTS